MKIVAVCDEERGCPLYKKQAKLEFTPPSVAAADGGPVCAIAVENLQKCVPKVLSGAPIAAFAHQFCGGCTAGKAWWTFEPVQKEAEGSLASTQFILNHVSKMKLFTGIHIVKLMRIARLMREAKVPAGQVVIKKGLPGEAFYIVVKGEFEVVQEDEQKAESVLAVLPPGECFGEMSLITGEPASASVRARVDSLAVSVSKSDFNTMLAMVPEIAITLARILANRLAKTGRWVVEELKKGLLGRLELISPAELIQAMNVNSQTGMLIVQNGDKNLTIYMHDGQIHEVQLGGQRGEEAFFEFLSWARGNFRFEPVRKDQPVKQVQMDTVGLLLEGMRRVDEYKQTGIWRKS